MTTTTDNGGLRELALFAGAGGGILGGLLAGWRTVCAVEWDAYAASILVARQNDGTLAPFPIWDDVQTFDGRPWRGRVDVVSGGFPCTDISAAGKGAGIDGEASGMWRHMARIIGEVRPRFVFVENSPLLVRRGLARVLGDLAALGYDARWGVLGAADVGAPHQRDRIWIVADASGGWGQDDELRARRHVAGIRGAELADARHMCGGHGSKSAKQEEPATARRRDDATDAVGQSLRNTTSEDVESKVSERTVAWLHGSDRQLADAAIKGLEGHQRDARESTVSKSWDDGASAADANGDGTNGTGGSETKRTWPSDESWWATEPDVGRVAHGVAHRVDRLRCTGNGQVPRVAALSWEVMR